MPDIPVWRFRKKTPAEIHQDPTHAEFFAPKGIAVQFVRESIQNSLDAAVDAAEPVRVVMRLLNSQETFAAPSKYLNGLRPHLEQIDKLEGRIPDVESMITALIIEDFNTSGLEGDPLRWNESPSDDESINRFYYFFKNIGRSGKSAGSRGRWGLGKTVFPSSSQINTFFGFTVRRSDGSRLLMGQAQLKEHSLPGANTKYDPYGFFALHKGSESDYIQHPIDSRDFLDSFCSDFQLSREAEPGLSVVVAYPREELQFHAILNAVIVHYFYQLLSGRLVVELLNSGELIRIDRDSIVTIANELVFGEDDGPLADALPKRLSLAAWAVSTKRPAETLKMPSAGSPKCSTDLFAPDQLKRLADAFAAGSRISLRVPVRVEQKRKPAEESFFDVFMEFDKTLRRGDDQYVNQGINISGNSGQAPAGVRALLIVEDRPLATLMTESENPSHELWQSRGVDKISQHYERGPSTVQFVKSAVAQLAALLLSPIHQRDKRSLREIFYIENDMLTDEAASGSPTRRESQVPQEGNPPPSVVPPIPPGKPKQFVKSFLVDGFQIKGNAEYSEPLKQIRIKFAYAVFRGNPWRLYDEDDFSLQRPGELKVDLTGVQESVEQAIQGPNHLAVTPTTTDFQVRVTGFDKNRALILETRTTAAELEVELE